MQARAPLLGLYVQRMLKYFVCISHLWENMKHIKPTDHFLLQPIFYQGKDTRAFYFSCAPTKHHISTKVHNDAMMD